MSDRTTQILKAVDTMLQVHDEWERDENAPSVPTETFEAAMNEMIGICDYGDVPAQCRDVVTAVSRLALEWEGYSKGVSGKRRPDGKPVGSFWGAFKTLMTARAGAQPIEFKQPEPVCLLMEQKVPSRQIAHYIWGYNGVGPFITAAGQVDELKLREEAKEPGKHTAGWIHPEQLERQREAQRALQTRLGSVSARENAEGKPDRATVLDRLKEGQYADVIARLHGITEDEVRATAQQHGLTVNIRPNLSTLRAPQEPPIFGSETEPARVQTDDDTLDGEVTLEQESADLSDDDYILGLSDGTRGAAEIVAQAKLDGRTITYQKVTAVLKKAKATV